MKRSVILSGLLLLTVLFVSAANINDETLTYDVMFKWGLINKKAGEVTIKTTNLSDDKFHSILVGRSAKWADRFYTVRDTLIGTISKQGRIYPLSYQKISHEGGEFKCDKIDYEWSNNNNSVVAHCDRYHQKKEGRPVVHSTNLHKADGYSLDMLSAFYYMRYIDYPSMKIGESQTMNIFSGKRKEILKITYNGIDVVNVAGTDYKCYMISFTFTSDGKKKTSDDIHAWISVSPERIPYKLQGKLPVGMVKCYYVPKH